MYGKKEGEMKSEKIYSRCVYRNGLLEFHVSSDKDRVGKDRETLMKSIPINHPYPLNVIEGWKDEVKERGYIHLSMGSFVPGME